MKSSPKYKWLSWVPQLNSQVWILAFGRLLSDVGTGFTMFYAPIFFVNQVGISSTQVGLAIGSASISGVLGRILGGSFADSRFWGRRRTLLLSAAISAVGALVLASSANFLTLVVGNLVAGMGLGLYWPPTEAVVADLTQGEQRKEAYALTRLADSLGMGIGIILGGVLISTTGAYRALFVVDAISFVVFLAVIYFFISETYKPTEHQPQSLKDWGIPLSDRPFLIFISVNIILTTYIAQIQSTLPLYFSKFVPVSSTGGFSEKTISALFAWHMILSIVLLIPITRILRRFTHPQALSISALVWAVGFLTIWMTGVAPNNHIIWAILGLGIMAIAIVTYMPSASALVADIAPAANRGIYLSINSLCWAVGYAVGPALGGYALDQSKTIVYGYWLGLAVSVAITLVILQILNRMLIKTSSSF